MFKVLDYKFSIIYKQEVLGRVHVYFSNTITILVTIGGIWFGNQIC
jgi:hypothetical protein